MQDDLSDEEAIAVTRTLLLKNIPEPIQPEQMSVAGMERLHSFGLTNYAKRLSETGIGYGASGRLCMTDPTFADPILDELKLKEDVDLAVTLACTSFGGITVITKAGHEIVFDPINGSVIVYEGIPDEPQWVEMDLASSIAIISDGVHGPDRQTGNDGKDLHLEAEKKLGKLTYGSCYKLLADQQNDKRFSADSIEIGSAISHIRDLFAQGYMTVDRIPYIPPEQGASDNWGDDWGE